MDSGYPLDKKGNNLAVNCMARELVAKTHRRTLYEDWFEGVGDLREALQSASELIAHTAGEKYSAECKGNVALLTDENNLVLEIRCWPSSGSHAGAVKTIRESVHSWVDTGLMIAGMIVLIALVVLVVDLFT